MLGCSQSAYLSVVAVLAHLEPRCWCPGCLCCRLKKDDRWTAPAHINTSSMVSSHTPLHYSFGSSVWELCSTRCMGVLHALEKSGRGMLVFEGAAICHAMCWATHGYRVGVHRDALCCLFVLTVILHMEVAASCLQSLQLEESVSLVCCEAPAGQDSSMGHVAIAPRVGDCCHGQVTGRRKTLPSCRNAVLLARAGIGHFEGGQGGPCAPQRLLGPAGQIKKVFRSDSRAACASPAHPREHAWTSLLTNSSCCSVAVPQRTCLTLSQHHVLS